MPARRFFFECFQDDLVEPAWQPRIDLARSNGLRLRIESKKSAGVLPAKGRWPVAIS
jgi:hypothetical protein